MRPNPNARKQTEAGQTDRRSANELERILCEADAPRQQMALVSQGGCPLP
jgi:hypothetical protein